MTAEHADGDAVEPFVARERQPNELPWPDGARRECHGKRGIGADIQDGRPRQQKRGGEHAGTCHRSTAARYVLRARTAIEASLVRTSIRCVLPSAVMGENPSRY